MLTICEINSSFVQNLRYKRMYFKINNMLKINTLLVLILLSISLIAQKSKKTSTQNIADLSFGVGSSQVNIAASYIHLWSVGKKQKLKLGIGGRFTSSFATDKYYTTANAKLTSGKTGPSVLFADDLPQNVDSFFVGKTQINALNISFNSEYTLSKKLSIGFNIDLLGFSFGASKNGTYINNGKNSIVGSKPSSFNALLISDNDIGSLNSELFIQYKLNNKWSLRGGTSFLFNEYTTNSKVQQINGISNDRFRYKSLYVLVGVSYTF